MKTREELIAEMAVIGCVRNPQAHTMRECFECGGKYGSSCNAYRHAEKLHNAGYRKQSDTVRGLMKDSIILLVKECIAAHACVQTENGNVVGYFLDDLAIDRIANDVAEAMEVKE